MQTHNFSLFESIKRRILRIEISQVFIAICVVLLAIWCGYNIREIFMKYNQDETIISLENSPPGITEFPGITICAPSIFKPQKLAEMFPKTFGVSFKKYRKWRLTQKSDNVEDDANALDSRKKEIAFYESLALENFTTLQILQNYSVRFEELIKSCDFFPINIRKLHTFSENYTPNSYDCKSLHPVLESIYEKKKCFTFFSKMRERINNTENESLIKKKPTPKPNNWGNKGFTNKDTDCNKQAENDIKRVMPIDSKNMNFDFNPSIEITINNVENDIWQSYLSATSTVVMTVHPPDIAQSRRDFLFFQVSKSTFNEITFTQKTTILLNTVNSKCAYYNKDEPYISIPTRDYCISLCVLRKKQNEDDCVNYYGVLSLKMFQQSEFSNKKICSPEKQKYESYLNQRKDCEKQCLPECVKTIFEVSGQMRNTQLAQGCKNNWWEGKHADSYDDDDDDDASVSNHTDAYSMLPENEMQFNQFQPYNKILSATDNAKNRKVTSVEKTIDSGDAEMDDFMNAVMHTSKYLRLRQVNNNHQVNKVQASSNRRFKRSSIRAPADYEPSRENGDCESQISVRISPKPFTLVKHQKAISTETFIGTIGGHLGIWLGLSLYKIIKFAVHTGYRLCVKIEGDCSKVFNYNLCS